MINKIQNERFKKNGNINFNLSNSNIQTKTVILEDGTYATEAFLKNQNICNKNNDKNKENTFVYNILYENDDILLSVICVSLTKLYLKLLSKMNNSFDFILNQNEIICSKEKKEMKHSLIKHEHFLNHVTNNNTLDTEECVISKDRSNIFYILFIRFSYYLYYFF